jgi:hypothetical protein
MRRIAFLFLIAVPVLISRGTARAQTVLGLDGQSLQGNYVCKGQGHTVLGTATGIYILLETNANAITGGELGEHVGGTFCVFSIGSTSTVTIDADNVGHLSLALKPTSSSPGPGPFGFGDCKPATETFEYNGINRGNTLFEFTETDSGVEAGGTCRFVK